MNKRINLARRQTIDILINECLYVIDTAPARTTLLTLSLEDRITFNTLINEMVAVVSSIEKKESAKSFIRDYTSSTYEIIYRMFLRTEVTTCRASTLLNFINDCERVADEKLGTLEELKKANDVKGTLVVQ